MIEPRNYSSRGAFVVPDTGAVSMPRTACGVGPAGVEEQGIGTEGFPGTWEVLVVSTWYCPVLGDRITDPRPAVWRPGPPGAKTQAQHVVSPREGNRVWGEGRRKSHRFIVPLKPGNLYRGDPVEGRERFVMESWLGNPSRALYLGRGSP